MKDKKKKVTVIVISILIVLILLLAIAYAYFSTQLSGTDQIVKVGELELVLDETNEGISLDSAIGINDKKGLELEGSNFKLINNGNKAVDYTIYFDDNSIGDNDERIDDKYLKYNLNKNGLDSGATLLTRIGANPNRILDSGTIEGNSTNEYNLKLWITDEVDGDYSGQVFSGKLRVEVSQARETVAEVLLADSANNINTDDTDQTFITGSNPNNYIWYSGKLWRAVSIDASDNSVKLVTQWNISAIPYGSIAFEESYIESWLNDTTVDGFLGNLRNPESFIKMDSKWNASQMSDTSKPPSESEGGTIVEDAVGLLNIYEYNMTGLSNGYLNNNLFWWTLTPFSSSYMWIMHQANGNLSAQPCGSAYGVRPSINLKPDIKIVAGDGTEDNPYRLMGDNDSNLEGVKLNTRYSGEYISFGTGDNNLYRIVSHETEGLTKITSAEPLKENGTFKTLQFGDSVNYSSTNTIGSFLNGEYLDSSNYLTSEQANMIEDDTTWYLGTVAYSQSYRLAKYRDINMSDYTTSITHAKVGLLRLGELMAGQFNRSTNNINHFTLTPYTTTSIRFIETTSNIPSIALNISYGIKPSLNLKSNVIITGGNGTLQNPFSIELN